MIWMLIIIATLNAAICLLLQKPLMLSLGILGSTAIFVLMMVWLVKSDKQVVASYFYSFSINSIVLVYITIDKEMGDVLYLFVTIIMSTTYLNIKNTIFSAILAKSVCLYSFFVLDLFGTDFGLIFYYLFSQFCFMMILSYLCYYFNQTLKILTKSEEENRLRAATLQENSKAKQVQIELLEQFSFELKQNIEEINQSSSFFYEQLTENSARVGVLAENHHIKYYDLLAQWESTSLTGKGAGVQVPHRSSQSTFTKSAFFNALVTFWSHQFLFQVFAQKQQNIS